MGLRPLDLRTWLDPDPEHPQQALRRELLRERRAEVYQALPGTEQSRQTVAQAVSRWVGTALPGCDDPLVEAAGLVRDDLCVVTRVDGSWRLVAAVVCFPSRWRLLDKVGVDVVSIHDPVPRYRARLGDATGKAFDTAAPRWRVNWTLLEDPELFQPDPPTTTSGPPDQAWYLRVERQCLVPVGDLFAFTIRTDVVALRDLAAEQRGAVLASATALGEDLAAYRGWRSR